MATAKKPALAAKAPAKRRATSKPATPVRRKRRTPAKKGFLSDAFSPSSVTAGGKAAISGAVGGASAALLSKFLSDGSNQKTIATYQLIGGFAIATILKAPNVGAGMAAIGAYNFLQISGMLADDGDYSNTDFSSVDLELLPTTLSDEYLQDSEYLQDDIGFSYVS
jgi:hypothetical protein